MRARFALGAMSAVSALAFAGLSVAAPVLKAPPLKTAAPAAPPAPAPSASAPAAPAASAAAHAAPSASAAPGKAEEAKAGEKKGGGPDAGKAKEDKPGHKPWENLTKLEDRLDALRKDVAERKKTLADRRTAEQERVRLRWGTVATFPAVREELRLHAMRSARLQRIQELAEVEGKKAAEARVARAIEREESRHERRMQALAGGAK